WVPALAASTGCMPASNKLNTMANIAFNYSRLLFGFGVGFVNFLHVFGRVFLEIFEAIFAAKLDLPAFVFEDIRLAHFAEFFTGNDAFVEWVGLGLFVLVGSKRVRE